MECVYGRLCVLWLGLSLALAGGPGCERRGGTETVQAPTTVVGPAGTASLALHALNPDRGPVGTLVEIHGTGFDPLPSANTVNFGGAPTTPVNATAALLRVWVPAGARTGPVAVTAGGHTVQGPVYTVIAMAPQPVPSPAGPPIIISVHPDPAAAGTDVELTAVGLDGTLANHRLALAGAPLPLLNGPRQLAGWSPAHRTGVLRFTLPAAATSGDLVLEVLGVRSAPYALQVLPALAGSPAPPVAAAAPAIDFLTPPAAIAGQEVALGATGLVAQLSSHTVRVDGRTAAIQTVYGNQPMAWVSGVQTALIRFTVPAGSPAGRLNVTVEHSGLVSAPRALEVLAAPELSALHPSTVSPGDPLRIEGKGLEIFHLDQVKLVFPAASGGTVTATATSGGHGGVPSATFVEVSVPATAVSGPLGLEVLGIAAAQSPVLTVNAPAPAPA
ncbi:MAG: IPT/TIG domain-containing protein, partial [Planctomycetes bacterium]|nr:IPT/TIG domain-containing protein [Planctomycetota bacterium]